MLFSGVKTIDKKPTKWKVINSWGYDYGNKGEYIADDDWVNKYVYTVVINKKYLSEKQKECLDKKPIKIKKWDNKLD
jgi:bleomycin hydrolase